ncbi:unnamed protein product [Closterium sp. NIES-53]
MRDRLREHPLLGDESRVLLLTCHGSMPIEEQFFPLSPLADAHVNPPFQRASPKSSWQPTWLTETSITFNDVALTSQPTPPPYPPPTPHSLLAEEDF